MTVWIVLGVMFVVTMVIKTAGPLFLGGRPLPPRAGNVVALLAPALLAALVVVDTFGDGQALTIDERVPGVLAGGAVGLRFGMVPCVLSAAAVTAVLRAL